MNTCKTCVHWVLTNHELRDGYRDCDADVFREDGSDWYLYEKDESGQWGFNGSYISTPKTEKDRVCYSYDEGGWFQTGPDFGCVHHRAKE